MITVRLQYIKQLLSTQAGNGLTPVGGIIVWPKDSDPSTSSNIWLECNGQTFDTDRFKKLYKVLGSNRVPNYQGMFLRGAGSQSFTQNNGLLVGNTSTNHTSGSIGQIQGDASRVLLGAAGLHVLSLGGAITEHWRDITNLDSNLKSMGYEGGIVVDNNVDPLLPNCWAHKYWSNGKHISGTVRDPIYINFSYNPKHYRYKLNYSTSTDEDGNQVIDNISLDEYTSPVEGDEAIYTQFTGSDMGIYTALSTPTSNEIRPVNIAVKYYIRAK